VCRLYAAFLGLNVAPPFRAASAFLFLRAALLSWPVFRPAILPQSDLGVDFRDLRALGRVRGCGVKARSGFFIFFSPLVYPERSRRATRHCSSSPWQVQNRSLVLVPFRTPPYARAPHFLLLRYAEIAPNSANSRASTASISSPGETSCDRSNVPSSGQTKPTDSL